MDRTRTATALTAAALTFGWVGCSTNPATGKRQLNLFSEAQEIQMGQEYAAQVVQDVGLYPDPDLQELVDSVGQDLASRSERPDLPWSFQVVDDAAVNAFALPGGPIFVTRGMLTHMGSTAELAAVLGHEIGHITGRHSVNQLSKAQLADIGMGLGAIASPELAQLGDLTQLGLGVVFLKFGRDAERQADSLAVRYLEGTDYPLAALAEVFTLLGRLGGGAEGERLPGWLSTHPDPEERLERVRRYADAEADRTDAPWGRQDYLDRLDGVVFGTDPRKGFFSGDTFYHPDLGFQLTFPEGWSGFNQSSAVIWQSPQQDAVAVLTLAREATAEAALQAFVGQEGVRSVGRWDVRPEGRDVRAVRFQTAQELGNLLGGIAFTQHGDRVYQIVGYGPADRWRGHEPAVRSLVSSFGSVTDRAVLDLQPQRIEIVRVRRDTTLEQFDRDFPSVVPIETLALVNGVTPDARLAAGASVKRVDGPRVDFPVDPVHTP